MRYRTLGTTGVEVSTQCLGTMMYGSMGNADHADCIAQIHAALDAGINFIDTADVYGQGESEEIVGKALSGRRDSVVLATKCFNKMGEGRNRGGGSRRWIVRAVEDSLRRLGTDHVDLLQMHRHDHTVALDETLGALSDLVSAGKVRYIGSSSFPAEFLVEAQWVSSDRRRERFVTEQPQYSIFARSIESAVLPTCARHHIGVLPWSPLAGGWLTGKYRRGQAAPEGSRYAPGSRWMSGRATVDPDADPRVALVEALERIADDAGLSMIELALGFVDAHPAVSSTIIGPRTRDQLDGLLHAADVSLDRDVLDAIDEVVPPGTDAPGIGHFVPNPAMGREYRRR